MNDCTEIIKKIKEECRLAMNGKASAAMRERGIAYKLNFGVEYPRIKAIASHYEPNSRLASELWKSDIRELQITAGIVQPADEMLPEVADIWLENIHNCELAEMTSMNLFARLPYAGESAFRWIASGNEMAEYCGYLTLARMLRNGRLLNERRALELIDQATSAALSEALYPRQGAMAALEAFAEQSKENAAAVKNAIGKFEHTETPLEKDFYERMSYATEDF